MTRLLDKRNDAAPVMVAQRSGFDMLTSGKASINPCFSRVAFEGTGSYCAPYAAHHGPGRLLGNTYGLLDLVRANLVLRVGDHPDRCEPFV